MERRLPRLMRLAVAVLALVVLSPPAYDGVAAQLRVRPIDLEDGAVAFGLVLRQLKTTAVFMQATAHPDDETNALHVLLNRGQGVRTILATATRGDGGQNEIGPELFDPLAVLRTEELAAVHRFDGTEQYFTRAVDFGYSFSIEETFEKWGRDEIVGDYVRLIRMTRPDVILGMNPTGTAGGLHHQASGLLIREAFAAAADPARYPEQIKQGLRPWRTKKFYYTTGFGSRPAADARLTTIDTSGYDPLLGRTYAEMGAEARSMHKCQAISQLLALPGPAQVRVQLVDSVAPAGQGEDTPFAGIDTTIAGLVQYVEGTPPDALVAGLRRIAAAIDRAGQQFTTSGMFAANEAVAAGLTETRQLRTLLATLPLTEAARYEIDERLKTKEAQLSRAVVLTHGIRFDALSDDGLVVPRQPVGITVVGSNRSPHSVTLNEVRVEGFETAAACPAASSLGAIFRCEVKATIPRTARPTTPYWHRSGTAARYVFDDDAPFGVPFRPTPFRVRARLTAGGVPVDIDVPVQYRYANPIDGEKRMELTVVPALSLQLTPDIAVVPSTSTAGSGPREVRVIVTNHGKSAATGQVALVPPQGWQVSPPSETLTFEREDELRTVRFSLRPDSATRRGDFEVRAIARIEQETFDKGYQVVEYPHIRRRQLEVPAAVRVKYMDVRTAPALRVGYVMGSGDEMPEAIQQLGAAVERLDNDQLAWGDLTRFDAIVIGVRAYDSRTDLQANNARILQYAEQGGVVLVQYNRQNEWVRYAPYPAKATNTRVTDENGKVEILAPDDPVFHYPNEIGADAWAGWVQERGTYFMQPADPRYVDLVQILEPFENNAGWKRGALVSASVGKGHWIFVGVGLWRQVMAGTDGAYSLLANLISRGKLPGK